MRNTFVVIVLLGLLSSCMPDSGKNFRVNIDTKKTSESGSSDSDAFVATNEWQEIKPDQTIPRGLHVRIDMTTGKKEAKLMDPDDKKPDAPITAVTHDSESNENVDDKRAYSHEELLLAMSKMGMKEGDPASEEELKRQEELRKKFRSYEELKKDLDSVKMKLQTDYEVLDGLVTEYESLKGVGKAEVPGTASRLASILEELEFHVHTYDTARNFADDGGFKKIVLPSLNSTHTDVRAAAAILAGAAVSSNPKVQIAALEAGLVESLLRVIKLDDSGLVRKRALFALSGLVRHFPIAQKRLVEAGGLDVLGSVFERTGDEDRLMQLKVVTLLHDLVLEHQDAISNLNVSNELHMEKVRQYEAVNLAKAAKKQGFCYFIPLLLIWPEKDTRDRRQDLSSALSDAIPVRPEHDVVEKVLEAMKTFATTCKDEFRTSSLATCRMLRDSYKELASKESAAYKLEEAEHHGQYYAHLAETASNICQTLGAKDEL